MSRKQHYRFAKLTEPGDKELRPGDEGEDVRALQTFLAETGYLRQEFNPGVYGEPTRNALRGFQRSYKLPDTGAADEETLRLIQRPRCGVPDLPSNDPAAVLAPFVLIGCRYNVTDLTYAFLNSTPDLLVARQQEIVREAFAAWAEVTSLTFTEVPPDSDPPPHFPISFRSQSHGDGFPFDDGGTITSNTLAHAFFPPPCGGTFAGALHFDEFERWTDASSPGAIRLLNVAIHEIGHLLGLNHSNNQDAIMFAFYDDNLDSLRPDDVAGIQAIYGAP